MTMTYRPNRTRNDIKILAKNLQDKFAFFSDPVGKNSPIFFNKHDKKIDINQLSLYTSPHYMVVDPVNDDSKVTLNGNSSTDAEMSNNSYGIVDIRGLTETSTSKNYKIKIITNGDQQICNDSIHAKCIIGTAKKPFRVWPLIVPDTQSLMLKIDDLSGSTNTIRPCFQGYKYDFDVFQHLPQEYAEIIKRSSFFIYTSTEDIVLPSTDVSQAKQIRINSNHDFLAQRLTVHSDGEFLIRMYYGRSSISNGWIHSDCLGGDGEDYPDFVQNIMFERTTRISLEIKNLSGSQNNVYLALSGIAIK